MNQLEFQEPFEDVAIAFSKKTDDRLMVVYREKFNHLNARQWLVLCDWATLNCDRFPTIKDLYRGMYELNMVARPRLSDLDKDLLIVVCMCGTSFAVPRHSEQLVARCPGWDCTISYDMPYIIHNADHYGVLWADSDIRDALKAKIDRKVLLGQVYALLSGMSADKQPSHAARLKEKVLEILPGAGDSHE